MADFDKNRRMLLLMPVLFMVAMVAPASAEEPTIDEVVVTATRTPVVGDKLAASAEKIIVDDKLRAFQGLSFAEALVAVPGLYVQSQHNAAQDLRLSLRGFGARGNFGIRGIRVFVDGMPEGLPDGQVQVDSLDPSTIASIEVLSGPAAAMYGNAAGGVILIETLPVTAAPDWRLASSGGAHGFEYYSASAKLPGPGADDAARFSVSRQQLQGYRQHAASEHLRLAADLHLRIDDDEHLQIRARATDAPIAQDPGGLSFADFQATPRKAAVNNVAFDAGESLDQQSIAWRWQRSPKGVGSLQINNYFSWRDFENRLPFRNGGSVVLARQLGGIGAQYNWQTASGKSLVTGVDLDRQRDRRQRFDNENGRRGALQLDQDEDVTTMGAFLGLDMPVAPRLALQAALRFDVLEMSSADRFLTDGDDSGSRRFNRLSPSVAVRFDGSDSLSVYGRFATAFETPTTTELANPAGAGFNPTVEPQASMSWEAGLRHKAGATFFEPALQLAAYETVLRDELVSFELAEQPGRSFFANAARSRRQGLEASADFAPGNAFSFRLSGSWAKSVFQSFVQDGSDYSGNYIPGLPALRLAASLNWQPVDNLRLGINAERLWEIYADNDNSVRSPDYLSMDLQVAYGINLSRVSIETHAGVRNLLNERFADNLRINAFGGRFYEPNPARYFYAGIRISRMPVSQAP